MRRPGTPVKRICHGRAWPGATRRPPPPAPLLGHQQADTQYLVRHTAGGGVCWNIAATAFAKADCGLLGGNAPVPTRGGGTSARTREGVGYWGPGAAEGLLEGHPYEAAIRRAPAAWCGWRGGTQGPCPAPVLRLARSLRRVWPDRPGYFIRGPAAGGCGRLRPSVPTRRAPPVERKDRGARCLRPGRWPGFGPRR